MFKKILIANRGEIAVRVIRTCRDMGITPVAVYSEADRGALHVRLCDEAFLIGPSPSAQSYLSIERLLDAAIRSKADAIHPGYGFLSENAAFAQACIDAGLTFIGPSPKSIALMGSKVESRRAAAKFGVPMIPGTMDPVHDEDEARRTAASIGYPIMLKASAGGGGKGLRVVQSDEELTAALPLTRAEALAAFGDDAVYMEKLLQKPRHIEVQVLADQHGHALFLGERECTIQRRHQKVIEECPSPTVDSTLRQRMGEAALNVVRAAQYYNAGTVEFLVDEQLQFYFLEMNTRLQVEHPVTEMVTGMDLVREQIQIAAGVALKTKQEDIVLKGSAIECRIYAEDPENNFFPSPGTITVLRTPAGPGIRDDSGVYEGWTVPIDYDPLISKLVAWGSSRDEAIERLLRALSEYRVEGIQTNLAFFREILNDRDFRNGQFDTGFIASWTRRRSSPEVAPAFLQDLAVIAAALMDAEQESPAGSHNAAGFSVESHRPASRASPVKERTAVIGQQHLTLSWNEVGSKLEAIVDGRRYELDVRKLGEAGLWFGWNGRSVEAIITARDQGYDVSVDGRRIHVDFLESSKRRSRHGRAAEGGVIEVRAPMPGKVVKVLVSEGEVKAHQGIVVVEAMKMQNEIRSPKAGRIVEIRVAEGDAIGSGDLIARVE